MSEDGTDEQIGDDERIEDPWDRFSEGMTLDDVVGDHNPKMIAIWGGPYTREDWFLRCYRANDNTIPLIYGLEIFHALNNRLPVSINELDNEGLMPLRPVDPVTWDPIEYGELPESNTDFLNVGISASVTEWILTYCFPQFPGGEWECRTEVWGDEGDFRVDRFDDERMGYPNQEAMRGYLLSMNLHRILDDYVRRRHDMPSSYEELLDGLWIVNEAWAANNPAVCDCRPGSFIFSIEPELKHAIAVWRDSHGEVYWRSFIYTPWPEGGWDHAPSRSEIFYSLYEGRDASLKHLLFEASFDVCEFIPSNVILSCDLLMAGGTHALPEG